MGRILRTGLIFAVCVTFVVTSAATGSAAKRRRASTMSTLRPVGSAILTDAQAASHVRLRAWEPRPGNTTANHTVPTAAELANFYSYTGQWGSCDNLRAKVTGNYTGTTDEIIQWAAWKWGLPENLVRAVAVNESWWRMSAVGDQNDKWQSYGLTQIKANNAWHGGTYPLSKNDTAFNVDYWAGMVRQYFEGCSTWLKSYSYNGTKYAAGDIWGSVGAWYSGDWHSNAANLYISHVKNHLQNKTWAQPGF